MSPRHKSTEFTPSQLFPQIKIADDKVSQCYKRPLLRLSIWGFLIILIGRQSIFYDFSHRGIILIFWLPLS